MMEEIVGEIIPAQQQHRKKHLPVEAPQCSLGSLFGGNDEEEELEQTFETSTIQIGDKQLQIRQFAFHRANGNQIWPGAFTLADFLVAPPQLDKLRDERILELGAATGAMSIFLRQPPFSLNVHTSDIDDEGEVQENIRHNFSLNGLGPPLHVPHTWGTGWLKSCERAGVNCPTEYKYIIASDILLYVSAYPALVQTLVELFSNMPADGEFIMVWNRRITASATFFELMKEEGFVCAHHGNCIYSFRQTS